MSINPIIVIVQLLVSCGSSPGNMGTEKDHMSQMADLLNNSIEKEYLNTHFRKGFYVKDYVPTNFFIYDLIDTANNTYLPEINVDKKLSLKSKGIYHFAPWDLRISFSHIAIINGMDIKIFRMLNCDGKGDKIEEIIEYIRKNYPNYDPSVLKRVINYRQHGVYLATDDMSYVDCKLANNLQINK